MSCTKSFYREHSARMGLLALGLIAAIGCGGDDDTGTASQPSTGAGSGAAGGGAPPAATFTAVYNLMWPARCVLCHGMAASDAANGKLGGLMDKAAVYAALVGKPAQGALCTGKGMYVVAGSPETSLLVQKLGASPPCGSRMPLGAATLSAAEMEVVSAWIKAGAKND